MIKKQKDIEKATSYPLIRYIVDENNRIQLSDPCPASLPWQLFENLMEAISRTAEEWNSRIEDTQRNEKNVDINVE